MTTQQNMETRSDTYQSHIGLARGGERCKPRLVLFHPGMHALIRPCCIVLIDLALEDVLRVECSGGLCIAERLRLR